MIATSTPHVKPQTWRCVFLDFLHVGACAVESPPSRLGGASALAQARKIDLSPVVEIKGAPAMTRVDTCYSARAQVRRDEGGRQSHVQHKKRVSPSTPPVASPLFFFGARNVEQMHVDPER